MHINMLRESREVLQTCHCTQLQNLIELSASSMLQYVCMYARVCVCVCVCVCRHMYVYICIRIRICIYMYMYIWKKNTYTSTYTYTSTDTYTYKYVYIHIHTHTHTHTWIDVLVCTHESTRRRTGAHCKYSAAPLFSHPSHPPLHHHLSSHSRHFSERSRVRGFSIFFYVFGKKG